MRSWKEKCALFGLWNHEEASVLSYFGLYAQQHRGQEGAGIVTTNLEKFFQKKGIGLVSEVFNNQDLKELKGVAGIGHTRYSTQGKSQDKASLQPFTWDSDVFGSMSLAHNGNLVNYQDLKQELSNEGFKFTSSSDTECFIHLINKYSKESSDLLEVLKKTLQHPKGAFSLVLLTNKGLIAIRDSHGFRPLVLGKKMNKDNSTSWMVASETCAFDLIGTQYVREILPGEIVHIEKDEEPLSLSFKTPSSRRACIFEHVYFARPDSTVFGLNVYSSRKKLGQNLALEHPVKADLVIPVPDSGVPAALGYSKASGIPFDMGIIRNHYIGRTFIHPTSDIRNFSVKIKLNPQRTLIEGKSIVVVDDSLVRGTTSKAIVQVLKQFGAKEVHLRIASPPIIHPCYYGIDTPKKEELISSTKTLKEVTEFVQADSIQFLSAENLIKSVDKKGGYCTTCFTGQKPF